jgi:hypothetical protein
MVGCEKHADTPKQVHTSDVCPTAEPANAGSCDLQMGKICRYTIKAEHQVHCHCVGDNWDCGTPLGIDIAATDQTACPPHQPSGACTLRETGQNGNRPGCFYTAAATPFVHDCSCAYFPTTSKAHWDCGESGGSAVVDSDGCRARQPTADSQCAPPKRPCGYGPNFATTCECTPLHGDVSTWHCKTADMPPMPSRP